MPIQRFQQVISGTTATSTGTSAVTEILGNVVSGLSKYDWFTVDASLIGNAVGTLDVYLQRQVSDTSEVTGGVWADWMHFAQLPAGASRVYYTASAYGTDDLVAVGRGTDASAGTPALSASTSLGGHPGEALRMVAKASTATRTGAALAVTITAWRGRR